MFLGLEDSAKKFLAPFNYLITKKKELGRAIHFLEDMHSGHTQYEDVDCN